MILRQSPGAVVTFCMLHGMDLRKFATVKCQIFVHAAGCVVSLLRAAKGFALSETWGRTYTFSCRPCDLLAAVP